MATSKKSPARAKRKVSAKVKAARKKPGGSNAGKYDLPSDCFVGPAGGAPAKTYPVCERKNGKVVKSKARAKAAKSLAHNAPNPVGIKKAVNKKFPSLKPKTTTKTKRKTPTRRK